MTNSWDDANTDQREHTACLVSPAKFTHPTPARPPDATADSESRARRAGQQLPGRQGRIGFGTSYAEWDGAPELLSVCRIAPEAL